MSNPIQLPVDEEVHEAEGKQVPIKAEL